MSNHLKWHLFWPGMKYTLPQLHTCSSLRELISHGILSSSHLLSQLWFWAQHDLSHSWNQDDDKMCLINCWWVTINIQCWQVSVCLWWVHPQRHMQCRPNNLHNMLLNGHHRLLSTMIVERVLTNIHTHLPHSHSHLTEGISSLWESLHTCLCRQTS